MKLRIAVVVALIFGAVIVNTQQGPTSSSVPYIATPITITNGGTGQITATLGFNALSPAITRGDLITNDGTNNVRFPKCTTGQILSWGANDPACTVQHYVGHLGAGTTTLSGTTHFSIGTFYSGAAGSGANIAADELCGVASTIYRIDFNWIMITAGTNETTALNLVKNGSTASTLAAAQTWNQTALNRNKLAITGLSVACTTADDIEIDLNGSATNFATDPVGLWSATLHMTVP